MVRMIRDLKKQFAKHSPARRKARKEGKEANVSGKFTKAHATTKGVGTREDGTKGARAVGHAAWYKLTGRSPNTDKKMTPQQRAEKLVDKHGSKAAAARAAGVNRRSFDRALSGKNVRSKNAEKIAQQERRESIRKTNAKRFKDSMTGVPTERKEGGQSSPANTFGVFVTIQVSETPEDRWIYPGRVTENAGMFDNVEDIIANGPEAFHDKAQEMMDNYVAGEVIEVHYFNW